MTLHNYRLMCLPGNFLRDDRACEDCLGRIPWRGVLYRCYQNSTPASAAIAASLSVHRSLRSFERVDIFLSDGGFVRRKHIEAGFPPERIRAKPQFTWATDRREGPGEYFLYVGRLHSEKGVGALLKAWRQAPGRLVVVGDGPEARRLRAAAPAAVEFTGQVPGPEVARLLWRARALLVPSIWYEGSPRTVVEAYAAGVPVVASRIGSIPDLVKDGVSGVLVPPGVPEAWARAAERLSDDGESERLGEGAWQEWNEHYRPEKGLEHLERAYEDALAWVRSERASTT